jgi:F0F1-type ATP synthase membrane subunit c/vacuolar-type H+-ATPase subunit K
VSEIDPAGARRVTQLVWGAMLASQAVYFGVLLAGLGSAGVLASPPAVLPGVLAAVAASQAVGAHILWRRASGAGLPLHAVRRNPVAAFQSYLIAWALDEAIGIYGLVLGLLGFGSETWAAFCAGGAVMLLLHRPRPGDTG